jgi:hypothetical protein
MATPGQKSEFHLTTPSTSKVDSNQGHTPKVLGIGALRRRNNVFLYDETLLKRNVACEILAYDLAWGDQVRRTKAAGEALDARVSF